MSRENCIWLVFFGGILCVCFIAVGIPCGSAFIAVYPEGSPEYLKKYHREMGLIKSISLVKQECGENYESRAIYEVLLVERETPSSYIMVMGDFAKKGKGIDQKAALDNHQVNETLFVWTPKQPREYPVDYLCDILDSNRLIYDNFNTDESTGFFWTGIGLLISSGTLCLICLILSCCLDILNPSIQSQSGNSNSSSNPVTNSSYGIEIATFSTGDNCHGHDYGGNHDCGDSGGGGD